MERLSEKVAVVSVIDPDAYAASTVNGDVIDMQDYEQVMFILQVGTLGSGASVSLTIKGDTTSGGSFTTTITGKVTANLTQAGSDSDKQAIITVTQDEVTNQGLRYLREDLLIQNATSDVGTIALGTTRYGPASNFDLASVDEIIN